MIVLYAQPSGVVRLVLKFPTTSSGAPRVRWMIDEMKSYIVEASSGDKYHPTINHRRPLDAI